MGTTFLRSLIRVLAIPLRIYLRINTSRLFKRVRYSRQLIRTSVSKPQNGLKTLKSLGTSIGSLPRKVFSLGLKIPRKIMIMELKD
jgi:hypothetical protein